MGIKNFLNRFRRKPQQRIDARNPIFQNPTTVDTCPPPTQEQNDVLLTQIFDLADSGAISVPKPRHNAIVTPVEAVPAPIQHSTPYQHHIEHSTHYSPPTETYHHHDHSSSHSHSSYESPSIDTSMPDHGGHDGGGHD